MKIFNSIALIFILTLSTVFAQISDVVPGNYTPSTPDKYTEGITNPSESILNTFLPVDATFRDETGKEIKLGDLFKGDKPALLSMMYFQCQSTCGPLMNEIYDKIKDLNLKPGKDFNLIFVSMEAKEGPELAAPKKASYVQQYKYANGDGQHFLTSDSANIQQITKSLNFKFKSIGDADISHPTVAYFITPKGKISRFFTGFGYNPQDIKFSLLNAGEGKIGSMLDNILVRCYTYNAGDKQYVRNSMMLMSIAGALTLLTLGLFLGFLWYQDFKKNINKSTT